MKTILLTLLVFCFCPYLARADTPAMSLPNSFPASCSASVPDVSNWMVVPKSRVDFRISEETAAYLGLTIEYVEYRNPANAKEFVSMVSRHIPLVFERKKQPDERLFFEVATDMFVQKEEEDRLNQLEKETDPILYVRWHTKEDLRTGKDTKDGNVDIWFLQSSGECLTVQNKRIQVQFLTENVGNGKTHNVFVGVRYQVGDAYHILKVDRRDIMRLVKGGK